jgi:hypothetical protein
MHKLFQDSIALIQYFSCLILFIIFTVNLYWEKIINKLLSEQTAADHPDLVTCVFHIKIVSLLYDVNNSYFSKTVE